MYVRCSIGQDLQYYSRHSVGLYSAVSIPRAALWQDSFQDYIDID